MGGWLPPKVDPPPQWVVQESCYLRVVRGRAPALSAASRSVGRDGGAHNRQSIEKAVCSHRRSLVI